MDPQTIYLRHRLVIKPEKRDRKFERKKDSLKKKKRRKGGKKEEMSFDLCVRVAFAPLSCLHAFSSTILRGYEQKPTSCTALLRLFEIKRLRFIWKARSNGIPPLERFLKSQRTGFDTVDTCYSLSFSSSLPANEATVIVLASSSPFVQIRSMIFRRM